MVDSRDISTDSLCRANKGWQRTGCVALPGSLCWILKASGLADIANSTPSVYLASEASNEQIYMLLRTVCSPAAGLAGRWVVPPIKQGVRAPFEWNTAQPSCIRIPRPLYAQAPFFIAYFQLNISLDCLLLRVGTWQLKAWQPLGNGGVACDNQYLSDTAVMAYLRGERALSSGPFSLKHYLIPYAPGCGLRILCANTKVVGLRVVRRLVVLYHVCGRLQLQPTCHHSTTAVSRPACKPPCCKLPGVF